MAKANKAAEQAADTQNQEEQELQSQKGNIESFASAEIDGFTAHIMIPKLSFNKKIYTAEELVDPKNSEVLNDLWKHAWTDENDQKRDEEEFERNGIFKIEY